MTLATIASSTTSVGAPPDVVALERLLSARTALRPFNAGDYDHELVTYREGFPTDVGPYHDYGGRDIRLTAEGRTVAGEIGERCAAAARELFILIGDYEGEGAREFRERGWDVADGAMRCLMLLAAGIRGALAGPVPDAEVMHTLAEYADRTYQQLRRLQARRPKAVN